MRATPQPNVPGIGIVASYRPRFWLLVVAVGVGAGLCGAGLIELLRAVQHLAWSYRAGDFLDAVKRTSSARRVLVLAVGGVVAGAGALALARYRRGEVSEAIWLRGARLPLLSSLARAVHSIVIVGLGASIGREAAPQQAGAALASSLSDWAKLPDWQRRLLVACGAGAGMAAVYNVPLGGALFALEVLLGTLALPLVLPALATSLIATATAWVALPSAPTYEVTTYHVHATLIVWALLLGPVAGFAARAWIRLIALAHRLRPSGPMRAFAPIVVFTALGALAIAYPQLLGNGKPVVQLALVGELSVALLAVLLVLKPLVTAACVGSGAPGGLFTPTLAYGVLLGGLFGEGWTKLWPGAPLGAYAIIGGAAVLGASMQGPLAAIVLLLELTHHADSLMVPMLLAVVEATVLARVWGLPSIYSARIVAGHAASAGDEGRGGSCEPPDHARRAAEAEGREFAEVVEPTPRW
jgi:chloride channel protein, CIC family